MSLDSGVTYDFKEMSSSMTLEFRYQPPDLYDAANKVHVTELNVEYDYSGSVFFEKASADHFTLLKI